MNIEKGSIMRGASRLARLSTQGFSISTASDKGYSKNPFNSRHLYFSINHAQRHTVSLQWSYCLESESPIYSRKNYFLLFSLGKVKNWLKSSRCPQSRKLSGETVLLAWMGYHCWLTTSQTWTQASSLMIDSSSSPLISLKPPSGVTVAASTFVSFSFSSITCRKGKWKWSAANAHLMEDDFGLLGRDLAIHCRWDKHLLQDGESRLGGLL